MVIDTSALVAILRNEPERKQLVLAFEQAEHRVLSAVSFVETSIVIGSRYGPEGLRDLDLFIGKARIEIVSVDEDQAQIARRAFIQYGKGGHPARLSLGDCFAYALAKTLREPSLCKGGDFVRTDIAAHIGSTSWLGKPLSPPPTTVSGDLQRLCRFRNRSGLS